MDNGWLCELLSGGIANKTKKRLGRCLVESVMTHGSKIWEENKIQKNKKQEVETDYL
jgi:hypothetical protein